MKTHLCSSGHRVKDPARAPERVVSPVFCTSAFRELLKSEDPRTWPAELPAENLGCSLGDCHVSISHDPVVQSHKRCYCRSSGCRPRPVGRFMNQLAKSRKWAALCLIENAACDVACNRHSPQAIRSRCELPALRAHHLPR